MDRRTFLSSLGAVGAGVLVPGLTSCAGSRTTRDTTAAMGSATPAGSVAGAAADARPAPGVQLYTLRGEMAKDVEGTLARVGALGYQEVEFAGYFDRTPAQIRDALAKAGLRAPSSHIPLDALEGDRQGKTLADAAAIGHQWIVVPWLAPDVRKSIDDYKRIATRLNAAATAATRAGFQFAYHNHDFEITPLEGRVPLEVLLAETDPALVKIEMDVYWTVKAGGDPLQIFSRFPGRVTMLHLKDSTGAPDHKMVAVGEGKIDWPTIVARGAAQGVRHAFVEHDNPADPWASVTTSVGYLKRMR